ncbi:hypothetical protein KIN20_013846 [Parelaphostrongylus tenuis]|uniref:E3 ubiquitin-protein ligase listerin n=1 Tax=Parelaphostrongylus tenuis TaxID=148309 RepID=A0AAD5ME50_PARTN|nr:hypothetical protein KIN20_013846 [Parelaphostrongylus tenuis]
MSEPRRRKGDAKSASSAQAAAFLERRGISTGFVGFNSALIFRKLSKKDHQTREKGLRDLLSCLKEKDQEKIETCYIHYAAVVDKLVLDDSPTVRLLALRLVSFFISSLKKAAEKQLKSMIPFVLIGTCDDTVKVAVDIVAGRHALVQPQKYDLGDSTEQRRARLTTQCLLAIARVAPTASSNAKLKESLEDFFKNTTVIKALLKGNSSVKSALLGICTKMTDCVPILLNTSQLPNAVISDLDASDASVCTRAFEAFVLLASDERFYEKFDVNKSVVPKLLSVVRKKGPHWSHASRFLLPCFALLIPRVADKSIFVHSFLDSFVDNLPFEAGGCMQSWMCSFAECIKYALSNEQVLASLVYSKLIDLLIMCVNVLQDESIEIQKEFVALLLWILEKDALPREHVTFLLDSLQLILVGRSPRSDTMCSFLVAPSLWLLRAFHVALLRTSFHEDFIEPLKTCSDDYLDYVEKNLNLVNLLSKRSQPPVSSGQVVLRVLRRNPARISELNLSSSSFTSILFTEFSSEDWPLLSSCLEGRLIPCLREIMTQWYDEKNSSAAIKVLRMLELNERGEVLSPILEKPLFLPFIVELMNSLELPNDLNVELSRLSFLSLFRDVKDDDEIDLTVDLVARFPPCEPVIRNVLGSLFDSPEEIPMKQSSESLNRVGMICSQLLYANAKFVAMLPSPDDLLSVLRIYDAWVSSDVIAECGLFGEPLCDSRVDEDHSEPERLCLINAHAKRAIVYMNIDCEDAEHDVSLAYAAVIAPVVRMLYSTRWRCEPLTDILSDLLHQWDRVFQKTALASSRAISALLHLPSSPSSAQLTLCRLRNSTYPPLPLSSWSEPEKNVAWYWALRSDCTDLKLNSVEQWITRFHFNSRYEFLSLVHQHVQVDSSEWEESIFNANFLDTPSWRVSCLCLVAALDVVDESSLSSISADLLDFILCGVVTAMDSCDERIDSLAIFVGSESSIPLESLAGLALVLFSKFARIALHKIGNSFDTEWPNFFLPTLSRIVVRWYSLLKPDNGPSFFVRSLVDAVRHIHSLPKDLSLKKQLCPELDKLGYDDIHQTLIVHSEDLLLSESNFLRFAALHMLKVLSPVMYTQENGQWMEEEKVSSTGPRHLVVPETLARLITGASGWPAIMAFDCALVPLSACITSDEERVAYCDALLHPVSIILQQILAKCPEDIPKAKERDYFVTHTVEFSVDIYERYAANLLYRTLGSLPAVVRNWYVGLPNTGAQIVSKYVRSHVSKLLVDAELNKVKVANQNQPKKDKLLKIRVVPVSGEVVAEYTVEETTMRLSIVMPSDWPLSVPSIQLDKAIVPSEKAKKWLLQLTAYLFHQNGSTVEGIMMWRRNVDRDVEGAEACTICMMTIHSTNHQLPKVKCRSCRNKFHSNCLYKWFESSSQSSCPLCRANFI